MFAMNFKMANQKWMLNGNKISVRNYGNVLELGSGDIYTEL